MRKPSRFPFRPGQLPCLSPPHQAHRNREAEESKGSSPVSWGPQGPGSSRLSICPLRGRDAKLPNSGTGPTERQPVSEKHPQKQTLDFFFFNRMTLGTRGREGGGRAKKGREKGVERGSLAERIVAGHSLKFTPRQKVISWTSSLPQNRGG